MSIRRRYFVTLISMCCWLSVVALPGARAADDLLDEDLGFDSGVGGSRFGDILNQTLSHKDLDAHFIINNLPVKYGRPSTRENLERFKMKLESALSIARMKGPAQQRGLILLLESGICFYQKQNMNTDAFNLMRELIEIKERNNRDSTDIVIAKISFAKIARTLHQYEDAERALAEALIVQRRIQSADAPEVGEIYAELFFLYTDMGKGLKAALSRKESIRCSGHDVVAMNKPWMFGFESNSWPPIINALDAAATAQDLEAALKNADDEAKEALKQEILKEKAEKEQASKEKQEKTKADQEKDKQDRARIDEDEKQKAKEAQEAAERARKDKIKKDSSGGSGTGGDE
ncbi:MAG: hypothetical protein K2W95_18490 [Candidatus Obscuribacterales bacterium]|nr:hypothetical protein [Candidatus Obscuribacterales bacterium]